jgi:hypothetical protein
MNRLRSKTTFFVAALVILASAGIAAAILPAPRTYWIEGTLDRAPDEAAVIDRIDIVEDGGEPRRLFVTAYRRPGPVLQRGYLSRWGSTPHYLVRGDRHEVRRLFGAPAGAQVKGLFYVYAGGHRSLLIAELDLPG